MNKAPYAIARELLDLIRCPVDGQLFEVASGRLVDAVNERIARRAIRDASDGLVEEQIDSALVVEDRSRLYAVRCGIPCLIPGEAIPLDDDLRVLDHG